MSVFVSCCEWNAALWVPIAFTSATVVSNCFAKTPYALPLCLPSPLSAGLGSLALSSLHVPVLPVLPPDPPESLSPPELLGVTVGLPLPDGVVGFFPPLPGVVVLGLVPCVVGECSRNGTRNAPMPAMMRAAAPSLRLLGIIMLSSFLPMFSNAARGSGYIIQRIVHQRTCQFMLIRHRNLSRTVGAYRKPIYCHRIRRNR